MKKRQGFTIIEVALFIAISGLILMGVIVSTSDSINQQYYNDSVQGFTDFLRGIYSKVSDPKSSGHGNSELAIFGKLVTFGEDDDTRTIHVYDIIGNAEGRIGGGDVLTALEILNASPILKTKDPTNTNKYIAEFAGFTDTYTPTWDAKVSIYDSATDKIQNKGALIIVRSPMSGVIYTFAVTGKTVNVQQALKDQNVNLETVNNPLITGLNNSAKFGDFSIQDIDFCIEAEGMTVFGGLMRDVRIFENAHNSSNISIIDASAEIGTGSNNNRCDKAKEE